MQKAPIGLFSHPDTDLVLFFYGRSKVFPVHVPDTNLSDLQSLVGRLEVQINAKYTGMCKSVGCFNRMVTEGENPFASVLEHINQQRAKGLRSYPN